MWIAIECPTSGLIERGSRRWRVEATTSCAPQACTRLPGCSSPGGGRIPSGRSSARSPGVGWTGPSPRWRCCSTLPRTDSTTSSGGANAGGSSRRCSSTYCVFPWPPPSGSEPRTGSCWSPASGGRSGPLRARHAAGMTSRGSAISTGSAGSCSTSRRPIPLRSRRRCSPTVIASPTRHGAIWASACTRLESRNCSATARPQARPARRRRRRGRGSRCTCSTPRPTALPCSAYCSIC